MCGSDETPPVSRKKFHLPHGASQGKRGTKVDRLHYVLYAVSIQNICLDLTWYEEILSRQSVWCALSERGFDLAFPSVLHHLVLQHPLTSNRSLCKRKDYIFVYRSYVYVIMPDLNNAVCSEHKTKSKSYWGWSRRQPLKNEIWPEIFPSNNQPDALIIETYSVIKLYMFRATSLPIIRSFLLYIRHC
jgi:hypothetical protein